MQGTKIHVDNNASLLFFSRDSRVRNLALAIRRHVVFERSVYFLIVLSSLLLALDNPSGNSAALESMLQKTEVRLTVICSPAVFSLRL